MSVDADTVRRIAHLARIAVAEDEVENLQGELNAILAFVEQLAEVDVDGVEPMTSVTPMAMKMREDEVTDGGIADVIVQRAGARGSFLPGAESGGMRMCLACEQDADLAAYLESQGLLKDVTIRRRSRHCWRVSGAAVAGAAGAGRRRAADEPREGREKSIFLRRSDG